MMMNQASKLGTAAAKGIVRLQEKVATDLASAESGLSKKAKELEIDFLAMTDSFKDDLDSTVSSMETMRAAGIAKVNGIAGMIVVDDAVLEVTSESVKDLVQAFDAQDAADIEAYGAYFEEKSGEVEEAEAAWGEFEGFADAFNTEEA